MTAFQTAVRNPYARHEAPQKTPRSLEYELLAKTTQRLNQTWQARDASYANLLAAIDANQKVWATFAADVAEADNPLPASLRAQLFYLYEFTVKQSKDIRDGVGSVEVLIDVNTAVMRGLRGEGGAK